jgi:CheY-like chemotaxis protein
LGDSTKLQQIFNNLTGNAIKFTDKGRVCCKAYSLPYNTPECYRVLFCVSDTGIGIDEKKIAHLFEAFTQEDEGYKRSFQGAGLGLSIVKQLIAKMKGNLSVISEKSIGTEFWFNIPFKVGSGQYKKFLSNSVDDLNNSLHHSLLVVEDDKVNRFALQSILEKSGFNITATSNGAEALKELAVNDYDLVLMDVQMPIMDGVEASKAIRSGRVGMKKSTIPIIALTAYALNGDKDTFFANGMDDYLSKPFNAGQLLSMVSKHLKKNSCA